MPLIIVLLAAVVSFSAFRGLFGVRSALQAAIYTFHYAALSVWRGVTGIPASLAGFRKVSEKNEELSKELNELRPQVLLLEEIKRENDRLRAQLFFKYNNRYRFRMLAAEVVGKTPEPWFSILEINQGRQAGVRRNMTVMAAEGLVGRVVEVSRYSAKVMLVSDVESSVAAVDARSRDFGLVKGSSSGRLSMKYVDAGGDIRGGDGIVTSNISAVFPPGIPIGEVVRASKKEHDLFYHVEIKPFVDFSKLEEVFVVF